MIDAYATFQAGEALKPFSYDPGELGEYQVEIDVAFCGLCHSDISMIDNSWGMSAYPLVAGHEVAGFISQVGSRVNTLKVGDRVGLGWNSGYCNQCNHCGAGDHNLCAEAAATIAGRHGGFAEKVRADYNSVIKIPEGIDMSLAGPLFCGGITVFNPLIQYNIAPTAKVAVVGIGGLGHMAVQFLRSWGCEVTAITSSKAKTEDALKLGAHKVLNARNTSELEAAAGRFDLIISTVNVALDWNLYLNTLAAKGRLHFVGATLEPLNINVFSMLTQQRSVSASPVGSPESIRKMLDFAARHNIAPRIEVLPMSEINQAIEKLRNGDVHYRMVLKN